MPLRPLADVSPADWFLEADADAWTKICLGPPGYEAYARVLHDLDVDADDYVDDTTTAHRVRNILLGHTEASEAYFGFWDGSGVLEEHPARRQMDRRAQLHLGGDNAPPAPWRSYHLLTGDLADADAWSDATALHLAWPADRAWFLAADVDPDWIGVGGTRALIDEVLAAPGLDAVPTAYDASDWESR